MLPSSCRKARRWLGKLGIGIDTNGLPSLLTVAFAVGTADAHAVCMVSGDNDQRALDPPFLLRPSASPHLPPYPFQWHARPSAPNRARGLAYRSRRPLPSQAQRLTHLPEEARSRHLFRLSDGLEPQSGATPAPLDPRLDLPAPHPIIAYEVSAGVRTQRLSTTTAPWPSVGLGAQAGLAPQTAKSNPTTFVHQRGRHRWQNPPLPPFVKGGAPRTGDLSRQMMCTNLAWSDLELWGTGKSPLTVTWAARSGSASFSGFPNPYGQSGVSEVEKVGTKMYRRRASVHRSGGDVPPERSPTSLDMIAMAIGRRSS